jgi:hypothetical protein
VRSRLERRLLWAPELSFSEAAAVVGKLEIVLADLPAVPAGYDGWFSIRGR